MCYLCFKNDLFGEIDSSKFNLEKKKERAKELKELINTYHNSDYCSETKYRIEKLKEEQYNLARDI